MKYLSFILSIILSTTLLNNVVGQSGSQMAKNYADNSKSMANNTLTQAVAADNSSIVSRNSASLKKIEAETARTNNNGMAEEDIVTYNLVFGLGNDRMFNGDNAKVIGLMNIETGNNRMALGNTAYNNGDYYSARDYYDNANYYYSLAKTKYIMANNDYTQAIQYYLLAKDTCVP